MTELLPALGALTLGGTAAVGLLALVSRSARPRYGAKWRCLAWLLLCLRPAAPVSLFTHGESPIQPPVQLSVPSDTIIYHSPASQAPGGAGQIGTGQATPTRPNQAPSAGSAASQSGKPAQTGFSLSLSQLITGAWLSGAAGMVLWTILSHLRFLRHLRRWAIPVEDPETVQLYNQAGDLLRLDRRPALLLCPGLAAPMLAGLLRPVLLLLPTEKHAAYGRTILDAVDRLRRQHT